MDILLSFAQEYEDIILYEMLKNVGDPIFYVDVGANDPVYISVTKFFYNMGGYGINVEPQHECIEKLIADRPRDTSLEVGVSDKPGFLKLYGQGTGASFDINQNNIAVVHEVPVRTLAEICNDNVPKGQVIHFLKIDVENFEKQVLDGMDFVNFRPWIVCMESALPGTDIPAWENWEYILLEANYEFLGMSGINRYYAAKDNISHLNKFCSVDILKKKYEIIVYHDAKKALEDYNVNRRVYESKIVNILKHIYGTK